METKSLTTSTKTNTKKRELRKEIPKELDINDVYNPRYDVTQLMSTRKKLFASKKPPRPPNSYFLIKNCYMLELRRIGLRFTMPELCIQSKKLWKEAPKEVKNRYEEMQSKAQSIHNELYPGYKFRPRKKQTFKMHTFPHENSANVTTFSSTNYLNRQLDNYSEPEVRSLASSNSSDSPKTNHSLAESEISTPTHPEFFKYSPTLSNLKMHTFLHENSAHTFPHENSANVTTFSSTNYLNNYSESEVRSLASSNSSDSPKTNHSLDESEISTPTHPYSFEYSLPLSNQFDKFCFDNKQTTGSLPNEEFNESLENFDIQNLQHTQCSISHIYNQNENLNVPIVIDATFFDLEQHINFGYIGYDPFALY
ncbi:2973_t:CDS:1 [Diversispora eburnea]|uniref:2973_t:CDS:1 n=1 Tax=Diversispora eburnea TaxID=1213867 RepID=A0A9N9BE63_9GLOM|nr:2973_t:CDS:1 [Diversispora eburnea]